MNRLMSPTVWLKLNCTFCSTAGPTRQSKIPARNSLLSCLRLLFKQAIGLPHHLYLIGRTP